MSFIDEQHVIYLAKRFHMYSMTALYPLSDFIHLLAFVFFFALFKTAPVVTYIICTYLHIVHYVQQFIS